MKSISRLKARKQPLSRDNFRSLLPLNRDNSTILSIIEEVLTQTKKSQILSVSSKLFREKGYAATSVRDIAREMNMEAPSLYNHISSKQQILNELLKEVVMAFTSGMKEIQNSNYDDIDKLERLVSLHVKLTVEHPDAIALINSEWVHLEGESKGNFVAAREVYEENFKKIVRACIEDGYLLDVNIDLATFSILSTLRGLYDWCNKNKRVNPNELEQTMIQCLIGGLRKVELSS